MQKMFELLKELNFNEKKKEFEKKFKVIMREDFNLVWNNWFNKRELATLKNKQK